MTERIQIKEEQIDGAIDALVSMWKTEMTEESVIPSNGLMFSAHEVAGAMHQRDHEVQASLRIGDKQRMEQALLSAAIVALHGYVSIRAEDSIEF